LCSDNPEIQNSVEIGDLAATFADRDITLELDHGSPIQDMDMTPS
jgi:hypothetical protein